MPEVLDLFNLYGIKATFFVEGETLLKKMKEIKKLKHQDHEIASHGYGHIKMSEQNVEEQMKKVEKIFKKLDHKPVGFRSPYLMPNPTLAPQLFQNGFKYDSSLVRAYFPFRYNYMHVPNKIYYPSLSNIEKEEKLMTIPLGGVFETVRFNKNSSYPIFREIPVSRIPGSFSAFSLLQSSIRFPAKKWWNKTENIVFYFHFHDIKVWPKDVLGQLPWYMQIINRFSKYHMKTLRRVIEQFSDREFKKMEELI